MHTEAILGADGRLAARLPGYEVRPQQIEMAAAVAAAGEIRGAVAFYGNSEAWSHTRYNDAMAISYFETFGDNEG